MDKVVNKFPNGVYNAKVSAYDPKTGKYIPKSNNKGESTMFPMHWTADRIKVEVDYAFSHRKIDPKNPYHWNGTTKSGVKVSGFIDKNTGKITTVYPKKDQTK